MEIIVHALDGVAAWLTANTAPNVVTTHLRRPALTYYAACLDALDEARAALGPEHPALIVVTRSPLVVATVIGKRPHTRPWSREGLAPWAYQVQGSLPALRELQRAIRVAKARPKLQLVGDEQ